MRYTVDGAAYVPFIGDGDIADLLYRDRTIFGADIDPARIKTARGRFVGADIREADCDGWPFPDVCEPFAVADIDSYANPYLSFRSFWKNATKADRVVVFGTDAQRQNIKRKKLIRILPDDYRTNVSTPEWRSQYNFWWVRYVIPWLTETIAPAKITQKAFYLRRDMLYWGIVCETR